MNLDFTETPLEDGLQNGVVTLFKRTEFKTLKRIIETKGKKSAIDAANKALGSGKFPNFTDAANALLTNSAKESEPVSEGVIDAILSSVDKGKVGEKDMALIEKLTTKREAKHPHAAKKAKKPKKAPRASAHKKPKAKKHRR